MEEAKVGKILQMLIIENVHHSLRVCVTQRILSPADPPKQDIECPLRAFGIIFFHSLSFLLRTWKRGLYFAVTICANSGGQGQRTWSLPLFFSGTIPLYPLSLTRDSDGWDFVPGRDESPCRLLSTWSQLYVLMIWNAGLCFRFITI